MQTTDERAPNVPDLPDGAHNLSAFGMLKRILPQAKGNPHGGGPAAAEAQIHFDAQLIATLGAIHQNQQSVSKLLAHLQKGIIAWQNPPYKLERLDMTAGSTQTMRVPHEAGERWLLASTWSLPADGNSAHTPDTLFIANGLADAQGRLTIPNGKTDWGFHVGSSILEFTQTSGSGYTTTVLALFRREWRYEDTSWSVDGDAK